MASVLFLIRVPYEESSQSLEGNGDSTSRHADDQNFNKMKFENDDKSLSGDCDANESNQAADDIEALTNPLNLVEVHDSFWNG